MLEDMTCAPFKVFLLLTQLGTTPSSLRVSVTDETTGQPVAGAIVELTDHTRWALTGSDGRVMFADVPPGPQHVAVRRIGYRPHYLHALVGGRGLNLSVALTPLPRPLAPLRVETSPVLALRDIERADTLHPMDRVLTAAAIRNHPLLSEPDALLATAGGHVGARAESPDGLHVMGGSSDQVAYLIDGIPVFNPYHAGAVFGGLNTDALHDVALVISPHSSALTDGLGGTLAARTRLTGDRPLYSGGISSAQSRFTAELPLGRASAAPKRAGLLLSGRLLFPGLVAAKREASQIDADASDGLARLDVPVAGGTLRALAIGLSTSMSTASVIENGDAIAGSRNDLEWSSLSYGASWDAGAAPWQASASLWSASTATTVDWLANSTRSLLESSLSETAARASLRLLGSSGEWTLAGRMHRRRSVFTREDGALGLIDLRSRATLATAYASRRQRFGRRSELSLGSTITRYGGRPLTGPFADARFRPDDRVAISLSAGRRHQFMQSLRNAETIVANIFPSDLYLNAGAGVPVARSDQASLAVQVRTSLARAFTFRVWSRRLSGLVLPSVGGDELAARSAIAAGTGRTHGVSIDASLAWARAGAMASYVAQHVRYVASDTTWTPESGVSHSVDAGLRLFPAPTFSASVAIAAVAGRRATPFVGALEWEACNLRDRGCEFAGGAVARDGPLGSLSLPGYVRLDIGLRKHWHVRFSGRDAVLGAYTTWTNLLNRSNVLTLLRDPTNGTRTAVGMRPGSPLVIGLDWSF